MTKEMLVAIFNEIGNANFEITTDIATGHGINGVSFKTYVAEQKWSEKERYGDRVWDYYNKINSIEIHDGYVCIETSRDANYNEWDNGMRREYVPLDRIVKVTKLCLIRPSRGEFIRKVSTKIIVK